MAIIPEELGSRISTYFVRARANHLLEDRFAMAPVCKEVMDTVSSYSNDILACYSELCTFSNLEPLPRINEAFKKLVSLCSQTPDEAVTAKVVSPP